MHALGSLLCTSSPNHIDKSSNQEMHYYFEQDRVLLFWCVSQFSISNTIEVLRPFMHLFELNDWHI